MLKIDNSLLEEVGLAALPANEKNSFLKHIYETLEMRVGIRLADQMTNQQLDEFEKYFEAKDDAGAFKWLETNFPNYKDIVQQEFDKLKNEVAQTAPQILAASQDKAAAAGQPAPAMPPVSSPATGSPMTASVPPVPPAGPAAPPMSPPSPAYSPAQGLQARPQPAAPDVMPPSTPSFGPAPSSPVPASSPLPAEPPRPLQPAPPPTAPAPPSPPLEPMPYPPQPPVGPGPV